MSKVSSVMFKSCSLFCVRHHCQVRVNSLAVTHVFVFSSEPKTDTDCVKRLIRCIIAMTDRETAYKTMLNCCIQVSLIHLHPSSQQTMLNTDAYESIYSYFIHSSVSSPVSQYLGCRAWFVSCITLCGIRHAIIAWKGALCKSTFTTGHVITISTLVRAKDYHPLALIAVVTI